MLKRPSDSDVSADEPLAEGGETPSQSELGGDAVASPSPVHALPQDSNGVAEFVENAKVLSDDECAETELEEDDEEEEERGSWLDGDTKSFLISLVVHVALIVGLASVPIIASPQSLALLIQSVPVPEEEPEFNVIDEIAYSDTPSDSIGANSFGGSGMALSEAPVVADVSEIPILDAASLNTNPNLEVSSNVKQAVGLVDSNRSVRGMTGVGTTGTEGAVDRITYEILRSIEERPTLVVWLFDASGSLTRRRQEIRDRFTKIYDELGIIQEQWKEKLTKEDLAEVPLLTSVYSFGEKVELLTENPTVDLEEITAAIDSIQTDVSGVERVFSALYMAADKYKGLRANRSGKGPTRNVMLIAVTDERGDDAKGLDKTVEMCRKFAMPVYVMGVPAPFGREYTYIKYVDPDPKYDQTPQWAQIDQGPETYYPERIQLGYEDNYFDEPIIDSGFGPFALSRLCYETGGIYFTVHPNRKINRRVGRGETDAFASHLAYFFDPDIMERYRPDYISETDYVKMARQSPMRQALLQASRLSRVGSLDKPRTNFIKTDEPAFVNALTQSQQEAARLEPKLYALCELLQEGAKHRDKEESPRWLASFDLSFGTALAEKVRTETYNLMLAKAKRGIVFEDAKSNTWNLVPSTEISVGSKLEKEGAAAIEMLQRVVRDHQGTPWAFLAQRELERPVGWSWKEAFTDLNPPRNNNRPNNNNNNPPPPRDDKARMIEKPPTRPVPKL